LVVDFDPVFAGTTQREGQIGCRDFKGLARTQAAHADLQCALRQLHLRDAVVEVEQFHAGGRPHADRRATDLQLGARAGARPQAIAGGQRAIDGGTHPVGLACRREAHRAAEVAQTRCTRSRLRRYQAAEAQQHDAGKCPQGASKLGAVHHGGFLAAQALRQPSVN
jgi:hypothetical protein